MAVNTNREQRSESSVSAPLDIALSVWFVLVLLAFWGPYLHLPLPSPILTALYGVFLLGAVASRALRILRAREETRTGNDTAAVKPERGSPRGK